MLAVIHAYRPPARLAHSAFASLVALVLLRTQLERNASSAGSASTVAMEPVASHARLGNSHTVILRSRGLRMLWLQHKCVKLTALTPLALQVEGVLLVSPVPT